MASTDPRRAWRQVGRHLTPGGKIELQAVLVDGSTKTDKSSIDAALIDHFGKLFRAASIDKETKVAKAKAWLGEKPKITFPPQIVERAVAPPTKEEVVEHI
jgi:chloramphenicol 3-O-phosphotransferase